MNSPHALRNTILKIALIAVLPFTGLLLYVSFARWPTGAAIGDGQSLILTTQPAAAPTLKVASYNIHSGVGTDGRRDIERIAGHLRRFDLVGLQETRGSLVGNSDVEQLTKAMQFNGLFSPTEYTRFHDDFGNAMLTRWPIVAWQRLPLPGTQSSGHRNVLMVRAKLGETPVTLLITHIDRVIDRQVQLAYLFNLFSTFQPPVVVMGDFNTRRDDPLLQPFLNESTDAVAATQPTNIDWIFSRGLKVIDRGVVESDASDHPLVWAEFTLP